MKKLYLSILALAMCMQLFAQEITEVKILPHPSLNVMHHGSAVAINGSEMIASSDISVIEKNHIRAYNLENNVWVQNQFIEKSSNEFQPWQYTDLERNQLSFGSDLDVNDKWLAVAADVWFGIKSEDDYNFGAMFMYEKVDGSWQAHSTIYGPEQNPNTLKFGECISMQGNWLVVGAPGCYLDGTSTGVGRVFIYQYNEINDSWEFFQSLLPNVTVSGERFGSQVKVDNNKLIVTSHYKTLNGNSRAGAVYFYEFDGATWGNEQEFTLENTPRNGYFGKVASLSGDYAMATFRDGSDKVKIFKHDGAQWNVVQDIDLGDDIDLNAGSMDGDFFVVADHEKWYGPTNAGVAYLYGLENDTWELIHPLAPSDGAGADQFGNDVYIKGGKVAIGAHYHDDPENNTGAVYIYSGFKDEPTLNAYFRTDPMITNATSDINFIDMSTAMETNIVSWSWDFNSDGFEDSNEQNPTYSYASGGTYPVTLTISDGTISSSITRWVYNFSASNEACFSYIPFQGTDLSGMGIAGWNSVNATSPEPIAIGHPIPGTELNDTAYYYLASRDYFNDEMNAPAMVGNDSISNWPNLSVALSRYGFTVNDLSISFGLMTLGNDLQDEDWSMFGLHEYRTYTGGNYFIKLKGEEMITGEMPQLDIHIAYNSEHGFPDEISGETSFALPINNSDESSDSVQAVAEAFLMDCMNAEIKLIFGSITPAIQTEFHANGRRGGVFDVDQAFLLKGCDCWVSAYAGEDIYTTSGHTVMLDGYAYGGNNLSYEWSPGIGLSDSTIANPTVVPDQDMTYVLTVRNENGCFASDTVEIHMMPYGIYVWEGKGEWDTPENWNMGTTPPAHADVFIQNGTLVVDENVEIQKLYIQDGVSFSIAPNVTATVDTVIMLDEFAMIDLANYESGVGAFINETPNVYATLGTQIKSNATNLIGMPVADMFEARYFFWGCDLSAYDETVEIENSWIQLSEMDSLALGKGYAVYHRSEETEDTLITMYGRLNTGEISIPVSLTEGVNNGFNLLGNPYPCKIDWSKNEEFESIAPAIYTLKYAEDGSETYGVWLDGISVNNQSSIIQPAEGFFIKAMANDQFTFTPKLKTASDTTDVVEIDAAMIKLKLTDAAGHTDETVIRYMNSATLAFDHEFDANKLIPEHTSTPQIFTTTNDVKYAINSFGDLTNFQNFSLNIWTQEEGNVSINIEELSGFHNLTMLDLSNFEQHQFIDGVVNLELEPNSQNSYQLLATLVGKRDLNTETQPVIAVIQHDVHISNIPNHATVELTNIAGQVFYQSNQQSTVLQIEQIPSGIYLLNIYNSAGSIYKGKIGIK